MGNAARPKASRHTRGPALLVATIVAALALLVPMTPAAADPLPSTVIWSVGAPDTTRGIDLNIQATATGPVPTGIVTVSEGSTELVRAPLPGSGWALVHLDAPVPGPRVFTISYLGSATVAPSSTTATINVQSLTIDHAVTGTVTAGGGRPFPWGPTGSWRTTAASTTRPPAP